MFVISTANQWLAKGDPVFDVYRVIHTPCAVAVDLPVVVWLLMFLIPVHMRCCDTVPSCTATDVPPNKCR